LAKKSKRIAIYLAENRRIATEEELATVTHPRDDDDSVEGESIEDERDEEEVEDQDE
jgi:hypothetical protein